MTRSGRIIPPWALAMALLAAPSLLLAAAPNRFRYDPRETFKPFDMHQAVNGYRSANGLPGPRYWQNRADYQIRATLDLGTSSLSGDEIIIYTNNSPDALDALWLQLDQNTYKADSRGSFALNGLHLAMSDGFVLDKIEIDAGKGFAPAQWLVTDTRLRVALPVMLAANGAKTKLHVVWHFKVPSRGGRTGWSLTKNGAIYDVAQWYPRMVVYDDIRGWDTLPYLAQEFYLEYGDFDYWVTLPSDMIVAGSGELLNPKDVLTPAQQARLAEARASDKTVMIRSPEEIGNAATRPSRAGASTWHFRMSDTRDVAFSASSAFAWDAARINLPQGRSALAMSFYPAESAGRERWGRSTEYLKDALENFSRRWYPYSWPAAVNVAGPVGGMEYPGIVFDGVDDKGKDLFWIAAHEIGHSYFPMIVGFDERRDAWMDEGFNTFIDVYESQDFNHGEYAPKRDSEYAPGGGNPVDEILPIIADPDAPTILSRADTIGEKYRHSINYFKSALGLVLLREEILGPDRFDPAFRRFIQAWAYKHPKPADFFRAMESEAGEDLSWWWRGWYENNWALDLAVDSIGPVDGNPAQGTAIIVGSHAPLVMPATVRVDFADGSSRDYRLPAESWIQRASTTIIVAPGRLVIGATVDPDHKIPDADRSNNSRKVASGPRQLGLRRGHGRRSSR